MRQSNQSPQRREHAAQNGPWTQIPTLAEGPGSATDPRAKRDPSSPLSPLQLNLLLTVPHGQQDLW